MITFPDPYTHAELTASLETVIQAVTTCFEALSEDDLRIAPDAENWNLAQCWDHIIRSAAPVGKALGTPRPVLKRVFGQADPGAGSRKFDALTAVYNSEISGGAQAGGRFLPEDQETLTREALQKNWQKAAQSLQKNLARWDDASLDVYQLPHPLLGDLTMREMIMFTLYHSLHHLNDAQTLLPDSS